MKLHQISGYRQTAEAAGCRAAIQARVNGGQQFVQARKPVKGPSPAQ